MSTSTTTVHIANLHCARQVHSFFRPSARTLTPLYSCSKCIDNALGALSPPPLRVDTSIVLQTVVVHHYAELSEDTIRNTLTLEGFDIADYPPPGPGPSSLSKHLENCDQCRSDPSIHQVHASKGSGSFKVTLAIGGMTCSSCTNTITNLLRDLPGVDNVNVSLIDNSGTVVVNNESLAEVVRESIDDVGYEAFIVSVDSIAASEAPATLYRATLSVGGMTCSSCSNTINNALSDIPGVAEVAISLLDNSAVVSLEREDLATTVRDTIEDLGYEATLVSVSKQDHAKAARRTSRQVSLLINGMFCP
jgi:P-type Cu+ transporter